MQFSLHHPPAKVVCERKQIHNFAHLLRRGLPASPSQSVTSLTVDANVSAVTISGSLLRRSVRVDYRGSQCGNRVASPESGGQVMTSIDTAGSQVSESEISATLVSLRERFEAVRRLEIQRVHGRLGNLSPDQENAIDSLSHGIIERVLQAPMAMLRSASARNQTVFVLETVRRIFNL